MTEPLRVWAPRAERVEVVVGERRRPLEPEERGWWSLGEPLAPGVDYAFSLDGGAPRPDPRSGHQPHGVHGPSRVVDHAAFAWSDAGFQARPLAAAVLYELHVGTFSPEGTFDGVAGRLDHLVELGVTHVQLMPVAAFPGARNWGYDGVSLYAPHHDYGGPAGLKRLVDACHARGLAVLMDVVYNHLGPEGNYLGEFGPYFTDAYKTPWGSAVNFDGPGSDDVRRFFIDNALMWLRDYHLDGLRLDAVHAYFDRSAVHFMEQLGAEVEALGAALGRHFAVIAESDLHDPRVVRPREVGGYGLDAQWSDDLHHGIHTALTGEDQGYYAGFRGLRDVAYALEHAYVFDGRYDDHRGRTHGRSTAGVPGWRFLGYAQTHDQVGNRAQGDRLGMLVNPARVRIAAAIYLCAPFVPMLFQGEEWNAHTPFQYFTSHGDADLGRAVREGRRREFSAFGWDPEAVPDPQAVETFTRSRLDWGERDRPEHRAILEWYRQLIALRHRYPELACAPLEQVRARCDAAQGWLILERGRVTLACNLGAAGRAVPVTPDRPREVLLAFPEAPKVEGQAVHLEPNAVAVLGPR